MTSRRAARRGDESDRTAATRASDEVAALRHRLAEAEDILKAIRGDEVDALVVKTRGDGQDAVLTLGAAHIPYAHLIDAMRDGAATLSGDGTILSVNRRFAELAGRDDLLGADVDEVFDERLTRMLLQNAGATPVPLSTTISRRDGTSVEVDLLASALPVSGARRIALVVSRRGPRTQSGIYEMSVTLRSESPAALAGLLDRLPVGIVWVDAQTQSVRYANSRAVHLLGRRVMSRAPAETGPGITAWCADGTIVESERLLMGRVLNGEGVVRENLVCLRDDGTVVHTRASATPITDAEGRIASVALMFEEASDDWEARTAGASAERFREHFIGVLGHDLRVPLSAVVTGSAILQGLALAPAERRIAERIASSAGRMMRMIAQILDFARERFGTGFPIERRAASIHEIVRSVLSEFDGSDGPPVEAAFEGEGKGHWDPDRLAQVVANLVENARTHGAIDGAVRVRVCDEPSGVRLEVHNTGEPIPRAILPVIFQPFRSTVPNRTRGLGMGLYIASAIVHAHGGTLTVESTADHGTTFAAWLPDGPPTTTP